MRTTQGWHEWVLIIFGGCFLLGLSQWAYVDGLVLCGAVWVAFWRGREDLWRHAHEVDRRYPFQSAEADQS